MSKPLVSVIMPAYNAERFVGAAVESILAQTFVDFEFIIINDGSTDGTLGIVEGFAARDPRIRLISRPNTGLTVALNVGLAIARGDFIARMDADDVSLPSRLQLQVSLMTRRDEVVAAGGWIQRIDEDGWPIRILPRPLDHDGIHAVHLNGFGGGIIHPAAMFKAKSLRDIGQYRCEWEPAEDIDLFLRLAEVGRLANIPEVVLQYRVTATGVSMSRKREQKQKTISLVNAARNRAGLAPLHERHTEPPVHLRHWRRDVVLDCLYGGNYATARKHLRVLLASKPWAVLSPCWVARCITAMLRTSYYPN